MSNLFSPEEYCRKLGREPLSEEATRIFLTARDSGELTHPIPTDAIPFFFPELIPEVTAAADVISADPLALCYYNFLRVVYVDHAELRDEIFLDPAEGDVMRNFAPALMLMTLSIPTQTRMFQRGIPEETRRRVALLHQASMKLHRTNFGFPAINRMVASWSHLYLVPSIFPIGSLEFEILHLYGEGTFFAQKETGEAIFLQNVEESEEAFTGNTTLRGGAPGEILSLPKANYDKILSPGDAVLSVHIPRKAKIDPATCRENYIAAVKFFRTYYPEHKFRAFYCRSWLMDPYLKELLPAGANIPSFQSFFTRFPVRSTGREVFSFVHPQPFESFEELPEGTSLERQIKRTYLEDAPIYVHAGFHLLDDTTEEGF